MAEGFLSRWARLKRERDSGEGELPADVPAALPADPSPVPPAPVVGRREGEATGEPTRMDADGDAATGGVAPEAATGTEAPRGPGAAAPELPPLDPLPPADLVVISYALGEVRPDRRDAVIDRAWQAARLALIVVEPGTMPGTARVLQARARLLGAGAHVVAPCPHERACPLTAPGWCHVPVRLERSRLHQQLKGVSVGFEDEKIAYVAVARHAVTRPAARIVAQPEVHKGHVRLHVCTAVGIEDVTVARRHGDAYRRARHARWGEGLDAPLP